MRRKFVEAADTLTVRALLARSQVAGRDGSVAYSGGVGGTAICPWTGQTKASGEGCTYDLPLPGVGSIRLFHAQGGRTNLFLNSADPATQTVTVSSGSVCVFATGTGYTITTAAGTATGSGFGSVTLGTAQVLTITVGGTITVTVTGSPVGASVRVEQASFPGYHIPTAGASVSRTADAWTWTPPSALSATAGEVTAIACPYLWSAGAGAQGPVADARMMEAGSGNAIVRATAATAQWSDSGGLKFATASAQTLSSGVAFTQSVGYGSSLRSYINGTPGSETAASAPWSAPSNVIIGDRSLGDRPWFGPVALIYTPGGCTQAEREALFRLCNRTLVPVA